MPGPDRNRERAFAEKLFARLGVVPTGWEESERPDCHFLLDDKHVGMEITESTPHEKYWGADIIQKLSDKDPLNPIIYCSTNLRNHGRRRSREELFQDMLNRPDGWVNMAESRQWWCEDVRSVWAKKRAKLNEPSFHRFDENWLLIWDNHGLGDDEVTFHEIKDEVRRTPFFVDELDEFDRVFVLSGRYTFDFKPRCFRFWIELDDGRCALPAPKGEQGGAQNP